MGTGSSSGVRRGGCAIKKCCEATEAWRRRGGSPAKPPGRSFGTTPPARPFLEFDGLAGTPPNLGGEFQYSCNDDRHVIVLFCAGGKSVGGGDEFRNHFRRRFFLKCPDTRH